MKIMLYAMYGLMIVFVFITIYITIPCIKNEYNRSIIAYNKEKRAKSRYYISLQQEGIKSLVKNNITQKINKDQVNKQVGYALLRFESKGRNIKDTRINKEKVIIGRSPSNDIVVNDKSISREQCLIVKTGKKFIICNVSKTNDTLLNGMPVNDTSEIKYGDVVEIGNVKFRFNDPVEVI